MKLNFILLYTFLLCGNLGFTQNLPAFKQYSIKGLAPKSDISSVYQDPEGFLWFSGLSGLYKYDGNILARFQHDPRDSTSLPHNYIVDFCEDSSGNFVCSSLGGGIFIMNKRTGKCTRPDAMKQLPESGEGGISHFVTHSLFSPVIWCGTSSGTLIKFEERTSHFERVFSVSPNSNAPGDKAIVDVLELQEDKLLIASYRGLYYFDASAKQSAAISSINRELEKLDSSEIYSLLRDNSDRIWIGYKGGVMIVDTHLNLLASLIQQVNQNLTSVVNAMAQLKDGKVLLGTGNGVFYWDDGAKELKSMSADDHSFEHSPKEVNHIYTDKSGNVWIATATQGLFLLNKNYSFFKRIPALKKMMSSSKLQAIMEDASGNWWIGGDSGLVYYKRNAETAEVIQLDKSKKNVVYSIFQDTKGGVWIGTMSDGLYYIPDPGKSFKKVHFNKILIGQKPDVVNFITSVNEDRFGNIWVGSFMNGVFIYDPVVNKFSHYSDLHNAPGDKKRAAISQIIKDKHGDIWVSTWSNGFNKFIPNKDEPSKGEFINYTNINANANSLSFPITSGIKEDMNGNIWIGTVSGGLNKFDPAKKQFTRFSTDNGLPSNLIYHIEEDKRGNIWFSTDEGLSMRPIKSSQFVSFKEEDGLPTRSFTFLSSCTMRDGTVAFGTIDGDIVYFQPAEMEKNTQTPAIVDFKLFNRSLSLGEDNIFNKPVHLADTFHLKHDHSVFTFEFSNYDFINPDNYTFAYKLEGVDKDWNYISNRKSATYTNLSPGKYTFRLKAANHLGVWSDKEIMKSIIVSPPWWLTWWAYISYAVLIIAALWTFIYLRSRRLIKEKKRLEHQVSIRTAEVVQQKEEIATQRDNIEHALHDLKSTQAQLIQQEKMASLGELTAGIAHEIQNPLNFVNNFSEVNTELIDELEQEIDKGNFDDAKNITKDLKENEQKIIHHGKRADAIVKGMLQHSRTTGGQKEFTDINKLADEYLRLAYHGLRAKDKNFNADIRTEFDDSIGKINIVPQDIGRVILNLINNAFYAVNEKQKQNLNGYEPMVTVATANRGGRVEVRVKDNGKGIPQKVLDKIFQPFFTTKPTGEGTGLGLSLAYDIIKAHGGEIKVETTEGEGSEFVIRLPIV